MRGLNLLKTIKINEFSIIIVMYFNTTINDLTTQEVDLKLVVSNVYVTDKLLTPPFANLPDKAYTLKTHIEVTRLQDGIYVSTAGNLKLI